jgi:hypothetical protein
MICPHCTNEIPWIRSSKEKTHLEEEGVYEDEKYAERGMNTFRNRLAWHTLAGIQPVEGQCPALLTAGCGIRGT